MTVVAVRKTKNKITMACDEQISHGRQKYLTADNATVKIEDRGKIYNVNGMLIGGAGYLTELNLFKLFCENHKPKAATTDAMLEFIVEFSEWYRKKTGDMTYKLYNDMLIVVDGKIFECGEGFYVVEKSSFATIGSGRWLALAALHYDKTPEEAVEVAKKYDLFCGGETQTLSIDVE